VGRPLSAEPLDDCDVALTRVKQVSQGSSRWTIVVVGTAVITLGTAVLVSGLGNLAIAPAMAGAGGPFPIPLSSLPSSMAIAVLITQNWLTWVGGQFAFAAIMLATGIAFLRRRAWAWVLVQGLNWVGATLLVVPIAWVARWVLAAPTDRILGLRAGLQNIPSGVGQPIATVLQLLVGGPFEWGWRLLGQIGVVDQSPATETIFAWTPAGTVVGTIASLGIPAAAVGLIVLLRRPGMREAFR
jgi:hypothetical protein